MVETFPKKLEVPREGLPVSLPKLRSHETLLSLSSWDLLIKSTHSSRKRFMGTTRWSSLREMRIILMAFHHMWLVRRNISRSSFWTKPQLGNSQVPRGFPIRIKMRSRTRLTRSRQIDGIQTSTDWLYNLSGGWSLPTNCPQESLSHAIWQL